MLLPHLIEFPRHGAESTGYISVCEQQQHVPFAVQRVFWTYDTPEHVARGRHAHFHTQQVLVAVAGTIVVTTELPDGQIEVFRLDSPQVGVYIPPNAWHTMLYTPGAVQLVLASLPYDEQDYIRSHEVFREVWGKSDQTSGAAGS
ncbi:WxcM-like domain-containing protein [Hymenobacter busanensis]|uniref:WxcM-like domain-containing protein n=1 Tax=Hymenobacter busanensis TaxID=2607656 RepID=A0A7L4ZWJ7_9BACT|nr:FdtA/QdtA family cupin domain-containing protein [Hymenobacter busanensis]KAA9332256.1 WxcM-like domain-containing protein [Hymenobacter busanensis]QHJ07407.1 WxcM-like domain-containing protein [Hymenobacter busanensis]